MISKLETYFARPGGTVRVLISAHVSRSALGALQATQFTSSIPLSDAEQHESLSRLVFACVDLRHVPTAEDLSRFDMADARGVTGV